MFKIIVVALLCTACCCYASVPRSLVSYSASIVVTEYDAWGCFVKDVVSKIQLPMDKCYSIPNKNSTQQTSLFITNAKKLLPTETLSILICTSSTSDCAMPFVCQKYTSPDVCVLPSQTKDSGLLQQTYPLNTLAPSWSWTFGPGTTHTSIGSNAYTVDKMCLVLLLIGWFII